MISQNSEEVTHLKPEVPTTTVVPSEPEAPPPWPSGAHGLQHPRHAWAPGSQSGDGLPPGECEAWPGKELIQPAATAKLVIIFPTRLWTPKALCPQCNLNTGILEV